MSEHPTYTIDRQQFGDHLQVALPDLGIVLETGPGKTKRADAVGPGAYGYQYIPAQAG
jgi:hypothetical protein